MIGMRILAKVYSVEGAPWNEQPNQGFTRDSQDPAQDHVQAHSVLIVGFCGIKQLQCWVSNLN